MPSHRLQWSPDFDRTARLDGADTQRIDSTEPIDDTPLPELCALALGPPPAPRQRERRRNARVRVHAPLAVYLMRGRSITYMAGAHLTDVSLGGVLVTADPLVTTGSLAYLHLQTGPGRPAVAAAQAVAQRGDGGFALRFLNLTRQLADWIRVLDAGAAPAIAAAGLVVFEP